MHTEVRAVRAKLLGRNRELDRLQQRIGGRARLRLRRRRPMAEGEETDLFHGFLYGDDAFQFVGWPMGPINPTSVNQCGGDGRPYRSPLAAAHDAIAEERI